MRTAEALYSGFNFEDALAPWTLVLHLIIPINTSSHRNGNIRTQAAGPTKRSLEDFVLFLTINE